MQIQKYFTGDDGTRLVSDPLQIKPRPEAHAASDPTRPGPSSSGADLPRMLRGFLNVDLPRPGFEKPGSGLICPEYPKIKAAKLARVVRVPFAFVFMMHVPRIRILYAEEKGF
jgi:hypothetical protein